VENLNYSGVTIYPPRPGPSVLRRYGPFDRKTRRLIPEYSATATNSMGKRHLWLPAVSPGPLLAALIVFIPAITVLIFRFFSLSMLVSLRGPHWESVRDGTVYQGRLLMVVGVEQRPS
jgi:hypothetical protein